MKLTSLTEILTVDRIKVPLVGTSSKAVIEELVDRLVSNGDLSDRQAVVDAVMERERIRTTGVGRGLAIPHGKSAGVKRLVLAVGRTAAPVDFCAIDGQAVDLVFLLVYPDEQLGPHIQALARISRIMGTETFRRTVREVQTAEEFYNAITARECQLAQM